MAECRHGLDDAWCSLCLHPEKHRQDQPILTMARFTARWAGFCRECKTSIDVGDQICKLSDGSYIHAGCE